MTKKSNRTVRFYYSNHKEKICDHRFLFCFSYSFKKTNYRS